MKVAFVGIKRKYEEIEESYRDFFDRFHLELPYYYSLHGADVTIVTVDNEYTSSDTLRRIKESEFKDHKFDVIIHWRKWFDEFYDENAVNVINCQDHSFSREWIEAVSKAHHEGKLYGILCFETWHTRNTYSEIRIPDIRLLTNVTLGVDTDIYTPYEEKNPYELLWASDPGRGLGAALEVFYKLYSLDRGFKLNVCYPDYVGKVQLPDHPSVVDHGFVKNSEKLWGMFNNFGVLPYTSTFKEPSSRAHRQAQAAGMLVCYPPDMGTPSELIGDHVDGIICTPGDMAREIITCVQDGTWRDIGANARSKALSENWEVVSKRFVLIFDSILKGTHS